MKTIGLIVLLCACFYTVSVNAIVGSKLEQFPNDFFLLSPDKGVEVCENINNKYIWKYIGSLERNVEGIFNSSQEFRGVMTVGEPNMDTEQRNSNEKTKNAYEEVDKIYELVEGLVNKFNKSCNTIRRDEKAKLASCAKFKYAGIKIAKSLQLLENTYKSAMSDENKNNLVINTGPSKFDQMCSIPVVWEIVLQDVQQFLLRSKTCEDSDWVGEACENALRVFGSGNDEEYGGKLHEKWNKDQSDTNSLLQISNRVKVLEPNFTKVNGELENILNTALKREKTHNFLRAPTRRMQRGSICTDPSKVDLSNLNYMLLNHYVPENVNLINHTFQVSPNYFDGSDIQVNKHGHIVFFLRCNDKKTQQLCRDIGKCGRGHIKFLVKAFDTGKSMATLSTVVTITPSMKVFLVHKHKGEISRILNSKLRLGSRKRRLLTMKKRRKRPRLFGC